MTFDLNHFREQYDLLAKQYKIPSFKVIHDDFELEKINQESLAVLRVVRKTMMDKVINTLSFLDLLLHPVNAPRVYLPFIKVMTSADKQLIDSVYSSLGQVSLRSLPLEIDYSEKNEAIMIREIYETWEEVKPQLRQLLNEIASPVESSSKRERSYYG